MNTYGERIMVRTIQNITYVGEKVKEIEERHIDGIELKVNPFSEIRIFIPDIEIKEIF